jgi:hypothetical protein
VRTSVGARQQDEWGGRHIGTIRRRAVGMKWLGAGERCFFAS